jgi:hypothetical protein
MSKGSKKLLKNPPDSGPTGPQPPNQYEPSAGGGSLTPAQFQDLASFFFRLGESKTAKSLAVLAAAGTILGGFHILWLCFLWVWGRLPR